MMLSHALDHRLANLLAVGPQRADQGHACGNLVADDTAMDLADRQNDRIDGIDVARHDRLEPHDQMGCGHDRIAREMRDRGMAGDVRAG